MKIAYDPTPLHHTRRLLDFPAATADLGFDHLQLTPHPDFATHFRYPKMDRDLIRRLKQAVEAAGITIPALLPVQRIAWPDEAKRVAAVKNFRRVIEIAVDLGVSTINTEFSGRPESFEDSEESFYRSMDELLPIVEKEGMKLNFDPHPDDFVEDGHEAWRVLRGLDSDAIGFVYVAPHTFHYGDCLETLADELGDRLRAVYLSTPSIIGPRTDCGTSRTRRPPRRGCISTSRSETATSTSTRSSGLWTGPASSAVTTGSSFPTSSARTRTTTPSVASRRCGSTTSSANREVLPAERTTRRRAGRRIRADANPLNTPRKRTTCTNTE